MAKLKAPLLSLGASGQLGEALVFFPWKGLNVARSYVIPSNPNTIPQQDQRGYLRDAVSGIHTAQKDPTHPLDQADQSAWALIASLSSTPRTWFNALAKMMIDQLVAVKTWAVFADGTITPGTDKLTVQAFHVANSGVAPTSGKLHYGTSKTNLINSIVCTVADLATGKDITNLETGVKYYVQYRADTPTSMVGCNSGIYYGVPT